MPWWFVSLEKGKRVPQYSSGGDNTSVMSPIKHMTPGAPPSPHWKLRWYVYVCSLWHKLHFERYAGMYTYVVDSAMKLMRWAMIILVWSIGGCWNTYGDICMRWKWLITKTKLKQEMYPHKQNTVPLKPKIACTHTPHFKKWFGDRKSKIILSKTKQELKKRTIPWQTWTSPLWGLGETWGRRHRPWHHERYLRATWMQQKLPAGTPLLQGRALL